MKTILRALLGIMLLGVLIGQSTFAQTVGSERSGYAVFFAYSSDPTTGLQVFAAAGNFDSGFYGDWSQANYGAGEFYSCGLNSYYFPAAVRPKITVSPNGSATIRFTPNTGFYCPFSEVVIECRATNATKVTISETNSTTKGISGTTHTTGYNVDMPECVIPGVGADYVATTANARAESTISTSKP